MDDHHHHHTKKKCTKPDASENTSFSFGPWVGFFFLWVGFFFCTNWMDDHHHHHHHHLRKSVRNQMQVKIPLFPLGLGLDSFFVRFGWMTIIIIIIY
jgi:hypothetical protein